MKLNNEDRVLLDLLQQDFPLSSRPFEDLAVRLDMSEEKVLARVEELKNSGIIRRIGGVIDARNMGCYSALCVCRVEDRDIERAAGAINQLKGVTHNYIRSHFYNLWFTLTASSPDEAGMIVADLEKELGITIMVMPAIKVYKIKAAFKMGDGDAE